MPKPRVYLQTMTKDPAKFQIDRYKTMWGDAHTRYPPPVVKYLSREGRITLQEELWWEKKKKK